MGEWQEVTLGEIYEFASGLSKPRSEFGSGYPFLSFKDVFYNIFVPDKLNSLVRSDDKERERGSIRRGDVFLTRTSETMDELGMSCVALYDVPDGTFNGFTKRLRPKSSTRVVPEYAGFFFRSPLFRQSVIAMTTMSTRASLNNEMLARLRMILPPVAEQEAIGCTLGALDDKIKLNRRMNETLEAMARAIFKDWFVDFGPTRTKMEGRPPYLAPDLWSLFPDTLDNEEKPVGWPLGSLQDLLVLQRGFDLPKSERTPGTYPVIAGSGIHGTHSEAKVSGPGVVTGRSGVIGNVFYIHDDFWPLNTSLWVKEFPNSSPLHAYFLIQTLEFASFNAGSAVPTLNRNHVHRRPMYIPPRNLVQAFDEITEPLMRRQRQNEQENIALFQTRDLLLPKLMSGEIGLREAEKQVEAVV